MAAATPQVALAIRNILVATDFSPCSERALLHAVAAARHFGSTLHLAHVIPAGAFAYVPPEAYVGTSEAVARAADLTRAEGRILLRDVLHRTQCEQLNHRTWVLTGAVEEGLRAILKREHIDLAVVGSHGRTGWRKLVLGSVAEEVFRHAPCPVLTVGPRSWESDPQSIRLRRILFPTDLSADSARALPFVMAIANDFSAGLTLLHVAQPLSGEAASDRPRVVQSLEQRMREMTAAVSPMPPSISYEVVFGEVAGVVIETAARESVDLVAFGLKAPDTLADRRRWAHAYKIMCEVACPVLSLRGPSGAR